MIKADGTALFKKASASAGGTIKIDKITVNGQQVDVTEIGASAFAKNKKLKKITIGPKIKKIGKKAFYQCVALTAVNGGKGLEQIMDSAFEGCKLLKKFTFNNKLTKIGKKAFFSCALVIANGRQMVLHALAAMLRFNVTVTSLAVTGV